MNVAAHFLAADAHGERDVAAHLAAVPAALGLVRDRVVPVNHLADRNAREHGPHRHVHDGVRPDAAPPSVAHVLEDDPGDVVPPLAALEALGARERPLV
ncbi:MAG: hypothetical protein ACK56I_01730, partial [bacterium]